MITVYHSCPFVPDELITACGLKPRLLTPALENNAPCQTEGMCSYTHTWLETLQEKAEKEEPFIAVFTTSCDQMRRAFEIFSRKSASHAFLLDVPATSTGDAFLYFHRELCRLKRFLCAAAETTFDERLLKERAPGNKRFCETAYCSSHPRIAITGSPVPVSIKSSLSDLLTASHAKHAFSATEDDMPRHFLHPGGGHQDDDVLNALAERYFRMPAIWKRPNIPFFEWFKRQIQLHRIDGVILFRYIFCDLWHTQVPECRRQLPVPVLEVDLEGNKTLPLASLSRIQAFVEMLSP